MRKHLLSLLLLVGILTSANAQSILGDVTKDGELSMADANALVNRYANDAPIEYVDGSCNAMLVGVWYQNENLYVEFCEDGTYIFNNQPVPGQTYKYYPQEGALLFLVDGKMEHSVRATLDDDFLYLNEQSAVCGADIYHKGSPAIGLNEIHLNEPDWEGQIGETLQLEVYFSPEEATNKNIVWTSSDPSVATVENGLVTALAIGSTVITATAYDGHTAECWVNVIPDQGTAIGAYENIIFVPDMDIVAEGKMAVPVHLNNLSDVYGIACVITLPEGMTFENEDDGPYFYPDMSRTGMILSDGNLLAPNKLKVAIVNSELKPFSETCGRVFAVVVNASSSLIGRQSILVSDIEISHDSEGKSMTEIEGPIDCRVNVVAGQAVVDEHEYVNLGLPSRTLWATTNLGAEKPTDYGLLYSWGETTGYGTDPSDGHIFDIPHNRYGTEDSNYTKYVGNEIWGEVDNKWILDDEDDAAKANWGAKWAMPSYDNLKELYNYCIWTWTTIDGVAGYDVEGPSGYSIFLPAAGIRAGNRYISPNESAMYITCEAKPNWGATVQALYFSESGPDISASQPRDNGCSIRPVVRY